MNRRSVLLGACAFMGSGSKAGAQRLTPLEVAYAGSMGSMMEGPIKAEAAKELSIEMRGRAQGSDALAQLIVGGSITPDVFVPVTPGPMLTVLKSGKATQATPVARTEMVIAYSPKSKYAQRFADAAAAKHGAMPWWRILEQPDLRFGRTDPKVDPQGRNIIFTLQLAEAYYRESGLSQKIVGEVMNAAQIFSEQTIEARLQSGELDAASAYKVQPASFGLPYIRLPEEINLGNEALRDKYARASLDLDGKMFRPQSLVYYAAVLNGSEQKQKATAFVDWLAGKARAIFRQYFYDAPAGAPPLNAPRAASRRNALWL